MAFIDNSGKVPLKYVFPAGWACERGRKRSSFTLNVGTWARARIQIHTLSRKSDFLFLPDSATVFPPSHPLASYYLELFLEVYQHLGNFFACCQLQFCFHCDVDSSVNKMLLHCHVADKMYSVCENLLLVWFYLINIIRTYIALQILLILPATHNLKSHNSVTILTIFKK